MSAPDDHDPYWDYDDDEECWQCGGEGFVANCQQEFACIDPESGCDLCTRRCDICNPYPRTADSDKLREILAEALSDEPATPLSSETPNAG